MTDSLTKSGLRSSLKDSLAQLSDVHIQRASDQVVDQIESLTCYQDATTILAYASMPSELSIDALIVRAIAAGKIVGIPLVDWDAKSMSAVEIESLDNNLQTGRYGLRSPSASCKPIPAHEISLALIPGLGFDPGGQRLGRGAGFYDRWIGDRLRSGTRLSLVGICFDEQLVERIPMEPHDQPMDRVVTPTAHYVREHG
ncbi:MAG: 5-formyltetrahydrofolate cyclo-ligase [Phycisphaerales bacterium]|nr:5-formyltetrahydrofolate cyclo-ligase [Phycisphaerales bacterium]